MDAPCSLLRHGSQTGDDPLKQPRITPRPGQGDRALYPRHHLLGNRVGALPVVALAAQVVLVAPAVLAVLAALVVLAVLVVPVVPVVPASVALPS